MGMKLVRVSVLSLGVLSGAGCGDTPTSPTPPTVTPPTSATSTLRFDNFTVRVVRGCDGTSQPGQYTFRIAIMLPSGETVLEATRAYPGDENRISSDAVSLFEDEAYRVDGFWGFPVPIDGGPTVQIAFRATEWDRETLASGVTRWIRDSFMNDRAATTSFHHSAGRWTNLGPNAIRLGQSPGCIVELSFSVSAP